MSSTGVNLGAELNKFIGSINSGERLDLTEGYRLGGRLEVAASRSVNGDFAAWTSAADEVNEGLRTLSLASMYEVDDERRSRLIGEAVKRLRVTQQHLPKR